MDQWKNKAMDQRSRQSNGPKNSAPMESNGKKLYWSIASSSLLVHCFIFSIGVLVLVHCFVFLHWSTALSSPLIYWCCFMFSVDWQSGGSAHAPEWHQSPRSHSFSHSNAAQPATASAEPQRQHLHQERGDRHGTGTLENRYCSLTAKSVIICIIEEL